MADFPPGSRAPVVPTSDPLTDLDAPVVVIGPDATAYKGGIAQFTSHLAAAIGGKTPVHHVGWYNLYPWFGPDRTLPEYARAGLASGPEEVTRLLSGTSPRSWLRAARFIAARKPRAVIHTWIHPIHAPVIRALSALIRAAHRCPQVAVCHNVLPHEHLRFAPAAARFALRTLDGIIVHSDAERREAARLALPPAYPLRLPIFDRLVPDMPRPQPRERSRLLFFGAIREYKGLDLLLRALPEIHAAVPGIRLHVAGERLGTSANNPLDLIPRLGLEQIVTVDERYIPDCELAALLAACDLAVLPFRSVTQSASVLLALGSGVPVVSSALPAIREVVREGENGCLAEPGSVASLRDTVLRALDLPFAIEQNELRSAYGWDRYAEELLALCRSKG